MRRRAFALLAAGLLLSGCGREGGPRATGPSALEGTWQAESYSDNGVVIPAEAARKLQLFFTGDMVVMKFPDRPDQETRFRTDDTKSPPAIDVMDSKRQDWLPGIYQREGDRLKLCLAVEGNARPGGFVARQGTRLFVLKRAG